MKSLYIHIPFCQQKCYYCDFCSFVCSDDTQQKYVDKLIEEIKFKGTKEQLKSVFIGGGTPSCLSENLIAKIMTAVSTYFEINETTEITIECNPNSLNEQKLKAYRCAGINRLSLGVQSLNDTILKTIGRIHTCKEFYNIAPLIQKYFSNFNFDIMIGLPNQTNFDVVDTIKKLMQFSPTHISMYSLILEENTKLFNQVQNNEIKLPLNDDVVDQYIIGLNTLKEFGFYRYEISNFCKKGYESKHNLNYWECGEYYGVGVSAHSYLNNERFSNTNNLIDYTNCKNFEPIFKEKLTSKELIEERIMLGLRTEKGLNIYRLKQDLNYDILKEKGDVIQNLLDNKFVKIEENHLKICEDKFYVSNSIIEKLI